MKKIHKAWALLVIPLIAVATMADSCDTPNEATNSSACGFVTGDGSDGHDLKLHRVVYPNQTTHIGDYEDIHYVPCNARNYIINDGTVRDANGHVVGDSKTRIRAFTSTGTPVDVSLSAYWTLNEAKPALYDFWPVCDKYQCASNSPTAGSANYSSPGWNGMLGEDFLPSLYRVAQNVVHGEGDATWQTHDPGLRTKMSAAASTSFQGVVRQVTGYDTDLFCGSGNSGWQDSAKPGSGEFTCSNVRIVIDDVSKAQVEDDSAIGTQSQVRLNKARLKAARAQYGPGAGAWLGFQDTIDKCKTAGITCIVNIGQSPITVNAR